MAGFDPEKSKYLCNPETMRVMVNTPDKRRLCPDLIPCNRIDASDIARDPRILTSKKEAYLPQPEENDVENQSGSSGPQVDVGFAPLRLQIETSKDKDELCQIGANLGLKMTKAMKPETMQKKLLGHIKKLEENT